MTKWAIVGDIHSNLEALDSVIADAQRNGATKFACIGDLVGYGPDPNEVVERVIELGMVCVMGNHEHFVLGREGASLLHPVPALLVEWTKSELTESSRKYIESLAYVDSAHDFLLTHSSLSAPNKFHYCLYPEDVHREFFEKNGEANTKVMPYDGKLGFMGHTHEVAIYKASAYAEDQVRMVINPNELHLNTGWAYVVNIGAVGQPRDGEPKASYVIYDNIKRTVEFYRVPYDIQTTQAKMEAKGLPSQLIARLAKGI